MRLLLLFWVAVELLQIAVIGLLAVGYRNLQRKIDEGRRFEHGPPPPSVTEG
jgi:hypothetical protein